MTNFGFVFNIASSITSISVSPKNTISLFFIPNLSALIFICWADSSPDTYKTCPSPLILSHICKIKVDLPIPGSPPSKVREPLTSPPPNTLSSSPNPVFVLTISCFFTSSNFTVVAVFLLADFPLDFKLTFSS